jgi:dimethylhistidine N-methyltransferase
MAGLSQRPRQIEGKYLWDDIGSALFDRLSHETGYYVMAREIALLRHQMPAIGSRLGIGATIVEFGSGAAHKTRLVLDGLTSPRRLVTIDIAAGFVATAVNALRIDYPDLDIRQVIGDYSQALPPLPIDPKGPVLGFFPGTSIANMEADATQSLLARIRTALGPSFLLIGQDPNQSERSLRGAYEGPLMADFHKNVLTRLASELHASLTADAFRHEVKTLHSPCRVEAHLVAIHPTVIDIGGVKFAFDPGESIRTDLSCKYTPTEFQTLAQAAGWTPVESWMDPDGLFALHLLSSLPL